MYTRANDKVQNSTKDIAVDEIPFVMNCRVEPFVYVSVLNFILARKAAVHTKVAPRKNNNPCSPVNPKIPQITPLNMKTRVLIRSIFCIFLIRCSIEIIIFPSGCVSGEASILTNSLVHRTALAVRSMENRIQNKE